MGGGSYTFRYMPKKQREVDDYPSCNFIVRTSIFDELGGFDTNFWPGEDTKLCLEITKKLGKKIIYDPKVLVYHHRRKLFLPHLKQVGNYAVHRGYFSKRFPETSLRFSYFLPSLFFIFILAGAITSLIFSSFRLGFMAVISVYMALVFISSLNKDLKSIPFTFLGIISTHLLYGAGFLKGLALRRLER
jgi:GT2 family glycosyltransferase